MKVLAERTAKETESRYLVKVVLVQLPHEAGEVGMLEHARKDGLRELVEVLDDEAVTLRSPAHDIGKRVILEHPVVPSLR